MATTTPARPRKRSIQITISVNDTSGSAYEIKALASAAVNAELPVSLRALVGQIEAAIRQTSAAVVALHGPITPPAEAPAPADVALGDEAPVTAPASPATDLDDLPF